MSNATKFCYACAASIDSRAEICPKCGVRQQGATGDAGDQVIRQAASTKLAAGLCAILVGSFGVHKFLLGMTTPGLIMLLVSLTGCGTVVMWVIGIVEGIIYLTKSDEEFYQTYVVEKKQWF